MQDLTPILLGILGVFGSFRARWLLALLVGSWRWRCRLKAVRKSFVLTQNLRMPLLSLTRGSISRWRCLANSDLLLGILADNLASTTTVFLVISFTCTVSSNSLCVQHGFWLYPSVLSAVCAHGATDDLDHSERGAHTDRRWIRRPIAGPDRCCFQPPSPGALPAPAPVPRRATVRVRKILRSAERVGRRMGLNASRAKNVRSALRSGPIQ